eukprot:scaffold5781_cov124-Isochrysis_galbana.AAC.13
MRIAGCGRTARMGQPRRPTGAGQRIWSALWQKTPVAHGQPTAAVFATHTARRGVGNCRRFCHRHSRWAWGEGIARTELYPIPLASAAVGDPACTCSPTAMFRRFKASAGGRPLGGRGRPRNAAPPLRV